MIVKFLAAFTVVLIVGIGAALALLFPQKVSEATFWQNLAWIAFLVVLNTSVSSVSFILTKSNKQSAILAILPALHLVVSVYSLMSATLLLMSNVLPNTLMGEHWHLSSQIVLSLILLAIVTSMWLATTTTAPENSDVKELETAISNFQLSYYLLQNTDMEYADKVIFESLKYSLPVDNSLSQNSTLLLLLDNSQQLVSSIKKITRCIKMYGPPRYCND